VITKARGSKSERKEKRVTSRSAARRHQAAMVQKRMRQNRAGEGITKCVHITAKRYSPPTASSGGGGGGEQTGKKPTKGGCGLGTKNAKKEGPRVQPEGNPSRFRKDWTARAGRPRIARKRNSRDTKQGGGEEREKRRERKRERHDLAVNVLVGGDSGREQPRLPFARA